MKQTVVTRYILLVAFVCALAFPLVAQGMTSGPSTPVITTSSHSGLEAEYSELLKTKVEAETRRVESSMASLFYGMTAFGLSVFIFGAVALLRARKQDAELQAMRRELEALRAASGAKA